MRSYCCNATGNLAQIKHRGLMRQIKSCTGRMSAEILWNWWISWKIKAISQSRRSVCMSQKTMGIKDRWDIILGRQNGTDGACENNRGNLWAGVFRLYVWIQAGQGMPWRTAGIKLGNRERVLDADINSYFGRIPHKRLLDCLKVKIKDPNILLLVKKYLKAGVMEDGKYSRTESGTMQGGNISPILANVYMHYMLTLWFYRKERHTFHGEGCLVNFADDYIACFQDKEDAEMFYADLKRRLADFGPELQEAKKNW